MRSAYRPSIIIVIKEKPNLNKIAKSQGIITSQQRAMKVLIPVSLYVSDLLTVHYFYY